MNPMFLDWNWPARGTYKRLYDDWPGPSKLPEHAPMPENDRALFTPTRCRVLKSFMVKGRPVEVGSIIELAAHDAQSMAALNKVSLL